MCGIAGLFSPQAPLRHDARVVDAMCRAIIHRGPDDQGICSHERGILGMRRLAIIDLNSGHQPIHNEDGSVWIVFNGEIYNFRSLRDELEGLGHRFATHSDTECIVHAYEEWGEGAFARLRGMFAVALHDRRHDRLVLARDRLGKKPLYHTTLRDGSVAFASELKCLLEVPGFDPVVSTEATRDYFALGYVPGPRTIYEGVHKLPPAHVLTIQGATTRLVRYWSPSFGPKWTAGVDELRAQLLEQLEDAVRVRLVSDVPFGAFLSGGTDSSVVAALMARNLSQPLKTFSIGFRESGFNELPDARRVARHIGAEHHEFIAEPDAVEMLDELIWHFDEPFGDTSAIPTWLVSRLAARHVKMVLSGDGGDELFGGYERYQRYQRLAALRQRSLGLAAPGLSAAGTLLPGARGTRLRRIGQRLAQDFPDDYLSGVALSTRSDLQAVLDLEPALLDPYAGIRHHFTEPCDGDPMDRILRGDMSTYLVEDILVKVDRMTMANSLEARAPLLDHQLVDFAGRLPFDLKLRGRTGKYLLKQVARELLPEGLLNKPKQGFAIPLARWMRGPLRERMQDTLGSRAFRERGLFHVAAVQRCFQRHLDGRQDHSELLWLVLNYEAWARRFIDSAEARAANGTTG